MSCCRSIEIDKTVLTVCGPASVGIFTFAVTPANEKNHNNASNCNRKINYHIVWISET